MYFVPPLKRLRPVDVSGMLEGISREHERSPVHELVFSSAFVVADRAGVRMCACCCGLDREGEGEAPQHTLSCHHLCATLLPNVAFPLMISSYSPSLSLCLRRRRCLNGVVRLPLILLSGAYTRARNFWGWERGGVMMEWLASVQCLFPSPLLFAVRAWPPPPPSSPFLVVGVCVSTPLGFWSCVFLC